MKKLIYVILLLFVYAGSFYAQGFDVKAEGEQTFYFYDEKGRNQATFESETPLEDITGTANGVRGKVTFDVADFSTLSGKLMVDVKSMRTGISLRDDHLVSPNWLDEGKYPTITYEIQEVNNIKKLSDNQIEAEVSGKFTMKAATKIVPATVVVTYLDESDQTKERAPGDLLGVNAELEVNLSQYGVNNEVVGNKVAEKIRVSFKAVGTNVDPGN